MESNSRERILDGIRRSLGRGPLTGDALAACAERLEHPKMNLRPKRAEVTAEERLRLFEDLATKQVISIDRVQDRSALPERLAEYLDKKSLSKGIKVSLDPLLDLPWQRAGITARRGGAEVTDEVGVSVAFCGVAETGSLVFLSSKENPIALCLLPPTHVIVLRVSDLVPMMEDAWTKVRERYGSRTMPRAALFVSGTSMTGDVGQMLARGASGPARVHLFLLS